MGQATPIVDLAGRPVTKSMALRIHQPRGQRKCKPDLFCEGMRGLIVDSVNRTGDRLAAAVDATSGSVEGVGFLLDAEGEMCIFNFCPNCGERFKFPANK